MKNLLLTLTVCLFFFIDAQAQQEDYLDSGGGGKPAWLDKVYVGGGIGGLTWSENYFSASVSGMVGYRFTEKLNTGVGVNYQYFNDKVFDYSVNNYGFNFFSQYKIYDPFFIMAQYEIYFIEQFEGRRQMDALLFGGGVSQPIGNKGFMNLYALYNVFHDSVDPRENYYSSPWVIGMNFGIGF